MFTSCAMPATIWPATTFFRSGSASPRIPSGLMSAPESSRVRSATRASRDSFASRNWAAALGQIPDQECEHRQQEPGVVQQPDAVQIRLGERVIEAPVDGARPAYPGAGRWSKPGLLEQRIRHGLQFVQLRRVGRIRSARLRRGPRHDAPSGQPCRRRRASIAAVRCDAPVAEIQSPDLERSVCAAVPHGWGGHRAGWVQARIDQLLVPARVDGAQSVSAVRAASTAARSTALDSQKKNAQPPARTSAMRP